MSSWLDGFAICASAACMIHCLALPLVLAALPALSDMISPGETFHVIVLALAVPTSTFALISGWRWHRAPTPLLTGLIGLLIMGGAIAFARDELAETVVTVAGSLLLAGAHIANWRKRRCLQSKNCSTAQTTAVAAQF